ncbi:hypothetical protein OsccyDRAFT_4286 [Leptolyngbyaceae cyanobacterium JSC-12]|nr:hypothetical protein OsccyDRAFT_4286 [Leptolyngbyaceae cyanobacterium JSC-12]
MAKKKKRKEPSVSTIKNDRSIFLRNTKNYLYSGNEIAERFHDSATITRETIKLINLLDKSSHALRKYLYPRAGLRNDSMLDIVNNSFKEGEIFTDFDYEIAWLNRFGSSYSEACRRFLAEETEVNLTSVHDCYREIIEIREKFGQIYFKVPILPSTLLENQQEFLRKALQTIGGTGLVCDDGLKYYSPNSEFSVKSIWLGFRMFLNGTQQLIEMAGSEEV